MCAVAPHAGAWIETYMKNKFGYTDKSHPMRVRGLKPSLRAFSNVSVVAPHAGAWIETKSP